MLALWILLMKVLFWFLPKIESRCISVSIPDDLIASYGSSFSSSYNPSSLRDTGDLWILLHCVMHLLFKRVTRSFLIVWNRRSLSSSQNLSHSVMSRKRKEASDHLALSFFSTTYLICCFTHSQANHHFSATLGTLAEWFLIKNLGKLCQW